MLKIQEGASIIIISIILAFAISLVKTPVIFFYTLLSIFLIISINTIAKKIAAYYADSEVEIKIWQLERWGLSGLLLSGGSLHPSKEFKKAFPIGALLPILTKIIFLPFTSIVWMASLIFEVKTRVYKSAKRYNYSYSFSEITDYQIALIATSGAIANLVIAIIAYFVGLPAEMNFANLSVFYVFFNLLPLSNLDGNKIFFGNKIMWYTIEAIALIGVGYAIFLP